MNKEEIVSKVAEHIKKQFLGEASGHDWWHIYRVWNSTKNIAQEEGCDTYIAELGALLHDIADYKFHGGDEQAGGKATRELLEQLGASQEDILKVVHIVDNISFKGGGKSTLESLEGKVVQDADRLDALGAIGIARTFAYSGFKGREMHNPEIAPKLNMTKEEYKNHTGTAVNHFYEKLLLLKDLMNTETAKKLAEERHRYMEQFLEQFLAEGEGER